MSIPYSQVQELFGLSDTGWLLYKDRNKKTFLRASRSKKLNDYHIR